MNYTIMAAEQKQLNWHKTAFKSAEFHLFSSQKLTKNEEMRRSGKHALVTVIVKHSDRIRLIKFTIFKFLILYNFHLNTVFILFANHFFLVYEYFMYILHSFFVF